MTSLEVPKKSIAIRRRFRVRLLAAAVLLVLVVLGVIAATRPPIEATQIGSPLLGKSAPNISGKDFAGKNVSLDSLRGSWVFVNFFASWCPPCAEEEPSLIEFSFEEGKHPEGAQLLSVVFNDSDSAAKQFVNQWGIHWPVIPDHKGEIANAFGVSSPPMTFLIAPNGTIDSVWAGPVSTTQLTGALASAKADQSDSTSHV